MERPRVWMDKYDGQREIIIWKSTYGHTLNTGITVITVKAEKCTDCSNNFKIQAALAIRGHGICHFDYWWT